ncbi:SIMPL domain-containing protein [Amphibiibacter pelophylacis]|uniref:SIMPL domain-containing protein n=1 Tax=Amphibiibacter pelophylacis TaxID=1799477 RepID=A0ACC6P4K2_9BURK
MNPLRMPALRSRHRAPAIALSLALGLLSAAAPALAHGDAAAPALGVVNLNSSATRQVDNDLLTINLQARSQGVDARQVQDQLRSALDAALKTARPKAKAGELDVQSGGFSLSPRYSNQGVISGWQGQATLQISGTDQAGIARLAGEISTMTVAGVQQAVSRATRERLEAEVTTEALRRFQARARQVSKDMGYGGYEVRELNVSSAEGGERPPMAPMMMRAAAMEKSADVPVEMGRSDVSINVSGSVQMTR